ncbi:serine hydrolase domain-containing protein [Microlunatus aurantiacus]|uniref:serine hydrolase domain-containing protein n=1 Tax=Microlunatus aurantiacus TaxID=446786 RepID=UPI0031D71985
MISAVTALLQHHVDAGIVPGAVAALGHADASPELVTAGVVAPGGDPMPADAIMRITSMTKVVTAVAALRLVEAGRIGLDDSLAAWLPELARPRVLSSPTAELDDTVPAARPITLRHLLTNTSGYGMILTDSPLQRAMTANGTGAGPEPVSLGADAWLARLTELPLAFQPGEGWRYHHSFGILGVLLSRLTGGSVDDHLAEDLFGPLGMTDTGHSVPTEKLGRLPAAYRLTETGLVETEPAGGGFYAGPPPFDVSHAELVSTAGDYLRFLRLLTGGGVVDGVRLLSTAHVTALVTDRVPAAAKTAESFFPGFWDGSGWGFGVAVESTGPHPGRYGWSGGLGTDFFVDPDGTVGILLTQVEMGDLTWPLFEAFQQLR